MATAKHEFTAQEYTASDVVDKRMTLYTYDVAEHKFPHVVDGLKTVHRRILWVMYQKKIYTGNFLLDSTIGEVIKIHPVGDMSINEATVKMAQPWYMGRNLIYGRGNIGNYSSRKFGAPRYLHACISPFARELFFENIHIDTIPLTPGENAITLEPKYLIPRLPNALLTASFTVGVGMKSNTLPLYLDNVCDLVKRYAEFMAGAGSLKMDFTNLGHLFIPDIPIKNTITNTRELIDAYNSGDYTKPIKVDSDVEIGKNSITIRTCPFGKMFEDVITDIKVLAGDKKEWLNECITGFHNGQKNNDIGHIELTFKQGRDTFEIFQKLAPYIPYSSSITQIYNFVAKSGAIVEMTPPSLLDTWYQERRVAILGSIKYNQRDEAKLLREKQVKLLINEHADEVIDIIKNKTTTFEERIDMLQHKFNLSYHQAEVLCGARIDTLSRQSRDELMADIEKHTKRCIELKNSYSTVHETIYDDAEYFKKKYHQPRVCRISEYSGYVVVNGKNIVQWDTTDDAIRILHDFPGSQVYTYPERSLVKYLFNTNERSRKLPYLSKYMQGSRIFAYPDDNIYTLWVSEDGKTITTQGFFNSVLTTEKHVIPIGNKFFRITRTGKVEVCKTQNYLVRKSTSRPIVKDNTTIYGVPYRKGGMAVLYVNDTDISKIHISKLTDDINQILLSPIGKTEFIGYIPLHSTKEYLFNYPIMGKGNYKYISIRDIDSLIEEDAVTISITINRKTKRNDRVSDMIEF